MRYFFALEFGGGCGNWHNFCPRKKNENRRRVYNFFQREKKYTHTTHLQHFLNGIIAAYEKKLLSEKIARWF